MREGSLYKELREWEIPVAPISPINIERQYRKEIASLIQEYRSKSHMPELIDGVWQGFWKQAVNISENQVPRCNRTTEEIALLEKNGKMLLLLPDVIFKPKGLVKLANAFPWIRDSWITNLNYVQKIKHNSAVGGCIDVEASISTPVDYTLLSKRELREKIEGQARNPQRIPTYITASVFRLLFTGSSFDQTGTRSRLLGSWYEDKEKEVLSASFDSTNNRIVFSHGNSDGSYPGLGGRSEGVSEKSNHIWRRVPYFVECSEGRKVA